MTRDGWEGEQVGLGVSRCPCDPDNHVARVEMCVRDGMRSDPEFVRHLELIRSAALRYVDERDAA